MRPSDPTSARAIYGALQASGFVTPELGARDTIAQLVELGALQPQLRRRIWDRLGLLDLLTAPVSAAATVEIPPPVLLADRADPALAEALAALTGGDDSLLGLVAPGRVLVARGGGPNVGRGCPRCAWLGERDQVSDVPPVPVEPAPPAVGARDWLAARCAQLVDAALLGLAALPPGHAWLERLGGDRGLHPIARHPGCACWHGAPPAEDVTFEALESRVFAPVWPVARGDAGACARVVFRRSVRGDVVSPVTLGVALGAGAKRCTVALAEAIERSAMHHGPADVRNVARAYLEEPAMSAPEIESLLFRAETRRAPGFRFPSFDPDQPMHWSRARALGGAAEVLLPTALVGHVPAEQRFVPATSNGYACHPDERVAMLGALLELVERDALLLSWFLGRPWLRLTDVDDPVGTTFLCTQDVDIPVVFASALADDGSLRSGSAAALELDAAVARAHAERAVALGARPSPVRRPGLERVDLAHGPEDHLARVAGDAGRVLFDAIRGRATAVRRGEIDRWRCADGDPIETVAQALADRGLEAWFVNRSMPAVFGAGWHVVRAIVPGLVELSFGLGYRRLAGARVAAALAAGETVNPQPHPFG